MNTKFSVKGFLSEFRIVKRACTVIRELSPGYLECNLSKAFINAVLPYIAIYMSALIVDELVGGKNPSKLFFYVLVSVGGTAILTFITSLLTKRIAVSDKMFVPRLKNYMNNKMYSMDYPMVENPKTTELHSKIVEIMIMTNGGMPSVIRLLCDLVLNFISLVAALFILFTSSIGTVQHTGTRTSSVLLFLLTLALILLSVCLSAKNSKTVSEKQYNLTQNSSTNRFLNYYHDSYMEDDKAGKDIHIFNQKDLIINEVITKGRIPWMNVLVKRYQLYQKYYGINVLISALIGGYAYIYVGLRALAGYISLGSVAKGYASITMLITALSNVSVAFSDIKSNNKYLRDFFEFMDLPSMKQRDGRIPDIDTNNWKIEFHDVSFHYPNNAENALTHVTASISSNSRTAIVGTNGSGKTTMIKLLCGLYQPDEGYITLNGKDINMLDYNEYLKLFTVVFQDFRLLALPIGENLAISQDYDEEKSWMALKAAGISGYVEKLPKKLQQHLYKYVDGDGIDLSGGEEQKLAIARACYKDASFVILDEPTAALDPVAEFDIYSRLNEIIENRAAVFISHRLSSCRFCDTILVFDQGKIVQAGTHDELLKDSAGKYCELWNAQAQYYK